MDSQQVAKTAESYVPFPSFPQLPPLAASYGMIVQPQEEDIGSRMTLLTRPQTLFRFYQLLLTVLFLFRPCHFRLAGRICAFSHKRVTTLLIPDVPFSKGHGVGSAVGETQILVLSCPKTRPLESHLPTRGYTCSQGTDKEF